MHFSTRYIILFSLALCLVSSAIIAVSAVALRPAQQRNVELYMKRSVLQAAGVLKPGEPFTAATIEERFQAFEPAIVDMAAGDYAQGIDAAAFNEKDVERVPAAPNDAQIRDVPKLVKVYKLMENGQPAMLILPIYGKGLWSTLLGYIAVGMDGNTVRGIVYYQHGETPGLGGEVDNPRWKALWPGRRIYDAEGHVKIAVIKGQAGPVEQDPHHVDGLSGATITSRGVSEMLEYWFGPEGYGPFLEKIRGTRSA